jgi:hypothetical protein
MKAFAVALACLALVWAAFAAAADTRRYSRAEAEAAVPVQINAHGSAKKDCTPLDKPSIRVIDPPASGTLIVRDGALLTNRVAGCSNLRVPAKIIIYQSRSGFAGKDRVSYEVKNANGQVEIFDITIDVKHNATPPSPKGKGTQT